MGLNTRCILKDLIAKINDRVIKQTADSVLFFNALNRIFKYEIKFSLADLKGTLCAFSFNA